MGATVKLSRVQREAVCHPGHLALIACPGSGKTRTLVAKLLDTLHERRGSTRLVACITYTNAAVREIESRLSQFGSDVSTQCDVETIHSFCLKHIVAPHSWRLPTLATGFSVVAPEDPAFVAIVDAIAEKYKLSGRARYEFEQLGRGTGILPDNIPQDAAESFWLELDHRRLLDFSSIIFWASKLVQEVPYIAHGIASRYRWVLVDEFQDTSSLQVDILRAVHRHNRTKFFIVGDPFQSIMSFAGARPDLMESFKVEIGARSELELLDNHRSSRNILALADALCPRKKEMKAVGQYRDDSHVPVWYGVPTMLHGVAELFIPETIRRGIPLCEVAVLANRWTSLLPIARGLMARQIPALGPGARPYRRSNHIIAPLVEEVAAHVEEPAFRSVGSVRRELARLIQMITKGTVSQLGFAGDVCTGRLIRWAREQCEPRAPATLYLDGFAAECATELGRAGFLPREACAVIEQSAKAMGKDIMLQERLHHLRTTTVADMGLFARGSNSVRLLTMHGSKGREFEAVALVDVFDGHVPYFKAKPGDPVEAEGRRLLYVAITRAKRLLMIFTLANSKDSSRPSRFLRELFEGPAPLPI